LAVNKNHSNGGWINKQAIMALNIKTKFLIPGKEGFMEGLSEARVDPGGDEPPGSLA
jgi:hypothetical protein